MSAPVCVACNANPADVNVSYTLLNGLCKDCIKSCRAFTAKLRGNKTPVQRPKQSEYEQYIASVKGAVPSAPAQDTNNIPDAPASTTQTSVTTESNGNSVRADTTIFTSPVIITDCSGSDSLHNNDCSGKEDTASEPISNDVSVSTDNADSSIDTSKPGMENNVNEMDASVDSIVVSSPTQQTIIEQHAPTSISSNQTDQVNALLDFLEGNDSNNNNTPTSISSNQTDQVNALLDLMNDDASSNNTPTTPVAKPNATAVKSNSFDIRSSIKFANQKGWLTNIFSPIASSISITGDYESVKKMRFAFVNKILSKHKAFHAIISDIERRNDYYEFLIPFDCYSNHKLDKEQRNAFISKHRDLCTVNEEKTYTPFTGCGFNIYKTGLALFDFDFKTYTYTYSGGTVVGSPVELKAIEDTSIINNFFDKLFEAIDRTKVLDVITKSNGHHIYCRWDGSLFALTTNTVDKGCRMRLGTSAAKPPYDGEYKEYWIELDIKVPIDTDKNNGICPLPGTVCINKLGKQSTYKLDSRSTESDINKLWSFKELSDKIASVYTELDYIEYNKNKYKSLSSAEKVKAILRDPEATEQEKMDAEALASLDSPLDDEDLLDMSNDIKCSQIIDDDDTIIFTDDLIASIIKGFEGIRIHGHHSVKANKDMHTHAEPSKFALKKVIYMLTTDAVIRDKLLDGIHNTASLTDNAKSGWNSDIPFDDKEWDTDMQRRALVIISSWIRSNNEVFYNTELANKLYRPGKDYFNDPTSMFTWQEFQERLDGGKYTSISTLMHDMAKVLAINTCSSGGRGYFVKRWFKEPKLGERARYNDFVYEQHNGPYVASMLDTIINVPTSSAERERQRIAKRKITEFKEVHVASLLKKDTYRRYLATFRGSVLWSDETERLSVYKPPAGKYNKAIVEYFIKLMKERVVHPKAWEEEFASHAYRIQRDGNVFIPKYFIHIDPNGHAGKSFNAAAFAQVYGERFSNAGATVSNMIDTYNAWMFKLLYINFEEVQYSNGRGFDIRDKLKQLTTKNGSIRDMYKVAETAEHKAIISINTNQKDLYGLVNSDPADLRRLVVIEFNEATADVIAQWESVVDKTIHDPDFGYSLFHYMCYDYKIPDWYKHNDHCTPDIRNEYIKRAKGDNENQISRWLGWLMAKPISNSDEDNSFNRELLLLNDIPESYQNWHDDWFLRTKLSKGIGDVAVQSKSVLWRSFAKFCGDNTKYNQTRLFKDMKEVYGFTECKLRMYGPKTNPVHSVYIPIDKLYELRSKYGGVSQYNENDEDVLEIEIPTKEQA